VRGFQTPLGNAVPPEVAPFAAGRGGAKRSH
jgi:hypothetical protein